jgi:hypothetical protein
MNYAELSLAERIHHAAQYAVLLKDDPLKTPNLIIEELSITFHLSLKEATNAYQLSKKEFSQEYKAATKAKNWYYLLSFTLTLICGAFYLFMSVEPGFGFFSLPAILFFISLVGTIHIIVKNLSENLLIKYPYLITIKGNFFIQLLFPIFLVLLFSFCQLKFGGIIEEKELVAKKFAVAKKIIKKKTSGRNPYWYYDFYFKNYEKSFRFTEFDYKYASSVPNFENYKIGDTITIEILKEDVDDLNIKSFFHKTNRIIGTQVNSKSIINYTLRYQQIEQNLKKWIYISSLVLLIDIIIIALGFRFAKVKEIES